MGENAERAELAVATAWEIYAQGGNGEGWTLRECFTALAIGNGVAITDEDYRKMLQVDPMLASYASVEPAPTPGGEEQ